LFSSWYRKQQGVSPNSKRCAISQTPRSTLPILRLQSRRILSHSLRITNPAHASAQSTQYMHDGSQPCICSVAATRAMCPTSAVRHPFTASPAEASFLQSVASCTRGVRMQGTLQPGSSFKTPATAAGAHPPSDAALHSSPRSNPHNPPAKRPM
jgi:hypothetical protein